jgi:hypothetical protein
VSDGPGTPRETAQRACAECAHFDREASVFAACRGGWGLAKAHDRACRAFVPADADRTEAP